MGSCKEKGYSMSLPNSQITASKS